MRKFFLSLALFALVSVQVHGLFHHLFPTFDADHNCYVCEVQSHTGGLEPSDPVILEGPGFGPTIELTFISIEHSRSFIPREISPRGPPIHFS